MADLFAGAGVHDLAAATDWYSTLFGAPPAFRPNDVEAVWEVGAHHYVYVDANPQHPRGGAMVLLFVDDLDHRLHRLALAGPLPTEDETYEGGVRKVTFTDADGNRVSFGASSPSR